MNLRLNWNITENLFSVFVLLFLLLSFSASVAGPLKILGVDFEKHKLYDRYIIRTSGYVNPKPKMLDARLVIDFKDATVERSQKLTFEKSTRVEGVRIGQFLNDPPVARVVFDLKRAVHYETASLYGKGEVVVELSDNKEGAERYASRPQESTKTAETGIEKPRPAGEKTGKAGVEARPKAGAIAGTKEKRIVEKKSRKLPLKGIRIVVDPGHGGEDPGAMGPGGVWEKEINLKTAFFLADCLRAMGARIYMTRKTDVRRKLSDIVDFADRVKADAYVGVHFNSMDNPKISGTETHYYTGQSEKLAEAIHNKLLRGIRREDRGIKRTMLFTIHHSRMPAIIVEPVYMTHFQDGLLIKSRSFQKEVARDIALGIEDFFNGR